MNRQLLESWSPVIEQTVGIEGVSAEKKQFLATICQLQENYEAKLANGLNENNAYATLGSVNGMGAVQLPTTQGNGWSTGEKGSGDVPYSLLPLAIQVAAQTIGLELVPTVPMNAPVGMLSYMDFVYAGGKNGYAPLNDLYAAGTDGKAPNSPIYIKAELDEYTLATAGATASLGGEAVTILGQSRIDGYAIIKLPRELSGSNTVASLIPSSTTSGSPVTLTFAGGTAGIISKAELVKALEDHVQDFNNNGGAQGAYSSAAEVGGMTRLQGETTPANVGNMTLFSKSVDAKTVQAAAAVTREQLMDLKQFGIDAVAQANQFLANEMTQQINKDILGNIFELGKTNANNIEAVQGINFHLVLGTSTTNLTIGSSPAVSTPDWLYFGAGKTVKQVDAANLGAENLGTRQRRLMSRLLAASNMISVRGRRGPATFAVCSLQTASGLQDCAGFVAYPIANTINQVPGALYPIGTLAGIAIYVDPNMAWSDGRIAVGRKGDGQSPGLVFMPYVMADTVETIAEGTMAPKLQMKSRYALVHAGHHPETMYLTFGVKNLVDEYWA
jgi:hypothetical protein